MPAPASLLPCHCFPSIAWWREALRNTPELILYTGPPVGNAGYGNRYRIATANGMLQLSIPLKGGRRQRGPLSEVEIDYKHAWQRQHWGALYSAYGRAPFFDHFGAELESILYAGHVRLIDLNLQALGWVSRSLGLKLAMSTTDLLPPEAGLFRSSEADNAGERAAYHQVFEDRLGFLPNLSIIDLLMAEGPYARAYML